MPTKEKPLWVDEPKPKKEKKPKLQELKPDENGNLVEVKEENEQTIKKPKTKNTKKNPWALKQKHLPVPNLKILM